jgi:hypothetical protein
MDIVTIAMGLAQLAPAVIKWFTKSDEAEATAQKVVDIATTVTGSKSPEEALQKIQADEEMKKAFRLAVLDHDRQMEEMAAADRRDARARDVELRKAGDKNRRADVMVIGAVVGLISCLAVLIFFRKEIPGEAVGIISTIAGIFGACLKDAYAFEFGSSRGSKEKDMLLGDLAKR